MTNEEDAGSLPILTDWMSFSAPHDYLTPHFRRVGNQLEVVIMRRLAEIPDSLLVPDIYLPAGFYGKSVQVRVAIKSIPNQQVETYLQTTQFFIDIPQLKEGK